MDNEKVKSDFSSSVKQIIVTFGMASLFVVIGLVLSILFRENSYPIEKGYLSLYPDEWASIFFSWFFVAVIVFFIINMLALLLAVYKKGAHRRSGAWLFWLFISLISGAVFDVIFYIMYPEDTWCMIAALIMFVAAPVLIFFVSTLFASNMWKMGYNPFSR